MELYKLRGRWRVKRDDGRKIKFDTKEDAEFYMANSYNVDVAKEPETSEPLDIPFFAKMESFEEIFEKEAEEEPEEKNYAVSSWRKKEEAQKGWQEEKVDEVQNENGSEESS